MGQPCSILTYMGHPCSILTYTGHPCSTLTYMGKPCSILTYMGWPCSTVIHQHYQTLYLSVCFVIGFWGSIHILSKIYSFINIMHRIYHFYQSSLLGFLYINTNAVLNNFTGSLSTNKTYTKSVLPLQQRNLK
jgi:hypothetical protein